MGTSDMLSQFSRLAHATGIGATLLTLCWAPAAAQTAPTLAGNTVQMIIGIGVGGGYDVWGRMVARHIGKHLPGNPTIVPRNMPGGGSINATNHIYNVAPKDGTVMGIITRDAILAPLIGVAGARFDSNKISWIGSPTSETNVCIAYKRAQIKVRSIDDLFDHELIMGATGVGSGSYAYPNALKSLLGMKFKVVAGFPSSSDVFLAMERGEVDGICESLDSIIGKRPNWIANETVAVLFQGGVEPNPTLKDVPFLLDRAKTPDLKQGLEFLYVPQSLGRPFLAPPDMPEDRLKMLRDGFDATMKDRDFIADVTKQKLDLDPVDGKYLSAVVKKIYETPKATVDKIRDLIK
jgi:tripartite-type tricarboxylate transporter receptor subunit TctC